MVPKLYMVLASPPVRAVLLCAKAINLELQRVELKLSQGEHLKKEYLKIIVVAYLIPLYHQTLRNMAPKLHMTLISPPVRAVLLCAKAMELELELIEVDLLKGATFTPEFLKINPLHTVPTLDDDGFILSDSHAIMGYLVDKYGKDKSLYPEDLQKRATINARLHFDSGTLFARHLRIAIPVVLYGSKTIDEENVKAVQEAYGFIETYLQNNKYIAGDSLSIADFSVLTSITNASVLAPLDEDKFPKIKAWRKVMQTLPCHEINRVGGEDFKALVEAVLK